MSERRIAIIPARGGSKRIPGKNIKSFLGKPIIAYSIELALSSGLFDEVMVSTDSEEIAGVAKSYGASVPFLRSSINANDTATTVDALLEVLDAYKNNGEEFALGCCLYPTAPLLQLKHLIQGCDRIVTSNVFSVFPVVAFSYPIWRGLKINSDGLTEMIWPENRTARSQDLTPAFHDAGQWYWFRVSAVQTEKTLFTSRSSSIIIDETEAQDIDTMTDWLIAEAKYRLLNDQNKFAKQTH